MAPSEAHRLRRSKAAKQVFADAEHFAALASSVVFQLIYSMPWYGPRTSCVMTFWTNLTLSPRVYAKSQNAR